MAWGTWFTELGCLMAYSADYDSYSPLMALRGQDYEGHRSGELPIEQPTTFILSINLKTATALGVTPPESVLLAADLVFE